MNNAPLAACGHPQDWTGLYRKDYDLATPESNAHPAKGSWDLVFRILDHLRELGLLKDGDTVCDPMCGTARFPIAACAQGLKAIGVELEPRFIDMVESYYCPGVPHVVSIKEETLPAEEAGWRTVPTGDIDLETELPKERTYWQRALPERKKYRVTSECRCHNPGWHPVHKVVGNKDYASHKLGRPLDLTIIQGDARRLGELLKERGLVTLTSPPYSDSNIARKDTWVEGEGFGGPHSQVRAAGYGSTPGQIGAMKDRPLKSITSPPYAGHPSESGSEKHPEIPQGAPIGRQYPHSEGQIADLPDRPLRTITSPPYEDSKVRSITEAIGDAFTRKGRTAHDNIAGYGGTEGQIGRKGEVASQEDYLSAMRQVYSQIALVSDVLVVVTKNPTRNGKLRLLDEDTCRLLEATGWRIHCRHRAILFEEHETHNLFGETKKRVKGRMSFFRRLAWAKGSPTAQWEDVIFAVRDGGQGGLRTVMSPPYISGGHHNDIMRSWGGNAQGAEPQYKEGYGDTPGQIGNLKDA